MKKDGDASAFKVRLSGRAYNKKTMKPYKVANKVPQVKLLICICSLFVFQKEMSQVVVIIDPYAHSAFSGVHCGSTEDTMVFSLPLFTALQVPHIPYV